MLLLPGLPSRVLRRSCLPAAGLAPQAPAARNQARACECCGRGGHQGSRPMKHTDEAALMTPELPARVRKFHGETAMSRRRAMTIVGAMAGLPLLCAGDRSESAP